MIITKIENFLNESIRTASEFIEKNNLRKNIEYFKSIDPSTNYMYVDILVRWFEKDFLFFLKNKEDIKYKLDLYYIGSNKKGINYSDNLTFNDFLINNKEIIENREEKLLIDNIDYKKIIDNNDWDVYEIRTQKASIILGNKSPWCISMTVDSKHHYDKYLYNDTNFYVFVIHKNEDLYLSPERYKENLKYKGTHGLDYNFDKENRYKQFVLIFNKDNKKLVSLTDWNDYANTSIPDTLDNDVKNIIDLTNNYYSQNEYNS